MAQQVSSLRQRFSIGRKITVRGASVLDEGQEAPFTVLLDGQLGAGETITIVGSNALRVRTADLPQQSLSFPLDGGGNTVVFLVTGDKPRASDGVRYAYESTVAVLLERRFDSAVVALCVRRSVLEVFLATFTALNNVAKAVGASAAIAGIIALVSLFIAGGDAEKVITGVISILIVFVFGVWFLVNTMKRDGRVKQVVEQNVANEGGFDV